MPWNLDSISRPDSIKNVYRRDALQNPCKASTGELAQNPEVRS